MVRRVQDPTVVQEQQVVGVRAEEVERSREAGEGFCWVSTMETGRAAESYIFARNGLQWWILGSFTISSFVPFD